MSIQRSRDERPRGWQVLLALLPLFAATGCGGDEATLSIADRGGSSPTASDGKTAAGEAGAGSGSGAAAGDKAAEEATEPNGGFIHEESATYRDPFRIFLADFEKRVEGPAGEEVPRTPTEQFAVNEFKIIGIITGTPVPKAMIIDPTGFGHVIRPGDRMGKEGGRVVAIYSNELVVQGTTSGDETVLYLTPPGEKQDSYQVNVVESVIETEAAKRDKAQGALKSFDLQALLGGNVQPPAEAEAGAATGGAGASAPAAELPAVQVAPLLPAFLVAPGGGAGGGGGGAVP